MEDMNYTRCTLSNADRVFYRICYADIFKMINDKEAYVPMWYVYLSKLSSLNSCDLKRCNTQIHVIDCFDTQWLAFFERIYACLTAGLVTHAELNSICMISGMESRVDKDHILFKYIIDKYEQLLESQK